MDRNLVASLRLATGISLFFVGSGSAHAQSSRTMTATAAGGWHLSYSFDQYGPLINVTGAGSILLGGGSGVGPLRGNGISAAEYGFLSDGFGVNDVNNSYNQSADYYTSANAGACSGSSDSALNPSIAASTVYYLYVAQLPTNLHYSNNLIVLAATVSPNGSGSPYEAIYFWAEDKSQNATCQSISSGAAFLGSFLTDPKGNVVPFVRSGNEVTLSFADNGVQQMATVGGPIQLVQQIGQTGISPPNGFAQIIPGALIPSSANAIVVDINAQSFVGTPFSYSFAAGAAGEMFNSFNTARSFFIPPGPTYASANHVLLSPTSQGQIIGIINGSCGSNPCLTTTFSYQGYIEDVRSPAVTHQ